MRSYVLVFFYFSDNGAILKIALKELALDEWPTVIQCARIGQGETRIARVNLVIPSSEHPA